MVKYFTLFIVRSTKQHLIGLKQPVTMRLIVDPFYNP